MRYGQLTFTRFLAAASIVVYHFGRDVFPFRLEAISSLFGQANMGVSYFFILSGFVMCVAYGNKEQVAFAGYIKKRFARIYPVYALAILLLSAFLIRLKPFDYEGLLLNITLTQSWIPGKALSFNTPGWSLSVEMFFYCLFPFLYNHCYKVYDLKKMAIAVLLFFIASQIVFHLLIYSSFNSGNSPKAHDFIFYFPLMHLNEFLIGNIAGLWIINPTIKKRNYDLLIIALAVLMGLLFKYGFGVYYHNGAMAFLFVPMIILLSLNNGWLTKIANRKVFVFLGESSYAIYILQVPVFMWGGYMLRHFQVYNPQLVFWINFIGLLLFSGICYRYIEKPLRQRINKA